MASPRRFGLDVGIYGPLATPEIVLALAERAEALDFESIWLADHVVFPAAFASPYPYSVSGAFPTENAEPLLEPMATMGVLAGMTRRVKLGTAVLVMPYRNPVLLARMLITLDQFSGGRVILGAGVGWLAEEFAVLGQAGFAQRGLVTDEYLEIFKALAAGGTVGYEGKTYRFDPVFSVPGSVQRPHPPILIGGITDAALRRAARLGNGWMAVAVGHDRLKERLARLKHHCEVAGRRYDELSLVYKIFLNIGRARPGKHAEREPGTGSVEEIIDDLKAILDLGFESIVVRYRGRDAGDLMAQITRFAEEIIPRV